MMWVSKYPMEWNIGIGYGQGQMCGLDIMLGPYILTMHPANHRLKRQDVKYLEVGAIDVDIDPLRLGVGLSITKWRLSARLPFIEATIYKKAK